MTYMLLLNFALKLVEEIIHYFCKIFQLIDICRLDAVFLFLEDRKKCL